MRTISLIIILFSSSVSEAQTDSIPSDTIPQTVISKEDLYNRGLVYYKAAQYPEAILSLDSCLDIDSFFTNALYLKAVSLEKSGYLKESAIILE